MPVGASSQDSLGLAGWMAKTAIGSPLTPLFFVALLFIGVLGLLFTPRQEDPQISVPMVDIFFQFPGASAEQVASLATDPLQRMMTEIPGVKHVYAASQRGGGMVTVQFDVGQRIESSLVKLYDKLASNLDKMPPGVSQPLVKPKGVDDVPTVTLTLWSEQVDDAALRQLALEVMQRLKEVPDTSQSFIVGGRSEQVRVEFLPERLKGFGISVDQLARIIQSANARQDVGSVETGGQSLDIYAGQFLRNAGDLERLIVGVRNGSPIYLRDVATVTEGPGEASTLVLYFTGPAAAEAAGQDGTAPATHGAPAVTIAVAKKTGTNGVTVADAILAQVESLKGRVIPDNVHVAVTRNYGETANEKVNELLLKMFIATGAVCVLIYLFLGLRPTIVVALVIPVVVLVTVFAAWLFGMTIDRVSLFALIFSIGILVDDATVVVENIYRRWLMKGGIDTATTVDAVREVGNPTILATFTVIAALLPMGFVSGMMGPYMMPIPVLGSVAMLASLFAAFIFTPWLAIRIRPSLAHLNRMEASEHAFSDRLRSLYATILEPLLDSPAKARIFRIAIWTVFALCCALFYTTHVTVKMLPLDNKPEFNVVVNMPEGTALPVTANVVQQLTETVLTLPEVTAVQTYAGTASPFNFNGLVRHYYLRDKPWEADIQIQLLDKHDRSRSSHEIAVAAREALTPLAAKLGARIAVVEMPPGPPVLQTMVAEVYGPDAATRRKVAEDLTGIFEKSESIVDVDNYLQAPHDTWVFQVNQQKAERRNVTIGDVSEQLSMVMGGHRLGSVKLGPHLESRFIVLQAPLAVRSDLASLNDVPIRTRDNQLVPLAELGTFVAQPQDPVIFHKDLRPVEYVTGEVAGRLAAPVYGMIEISRLLADYRTPDGVELSGGLVGPPSDSFKSGFEWTGEWTVTYETFRDMGLAFVAALVLIYMLVVMEFGNFRLPGIIMAPIPLTLIGIIPGHWLLGAEFTATSMIGWIALAGIIVRNSILLVDFSKHAIAAGVPVREAVLEAARTRTRPIVITSLALVAGSASILTDPIFQGMAISLLFGAIVSTVLTLIVIPLACANAPGAFATGGDIVGEEAATTPQRVRSGPAMPPAAAQAAQGSSVMSTLGMISLGLAAIIWLPLHIAGAGLRSLIRGQPSSPPASVGSIRTVNGTAWGWATAGTLATGLYAFVREALGHLLGSSGRSPPSPTRAADAAPSAHAGPTDEPAGPARTHRLPEPDTAESAPTTEPDEEIIGLAKVQGEAVTHLADPAHTSGTGDTAWKPTRYRKVKRPMARTDSASSGPVGVARQAAAAAVAAATPGVEPSLTVAPKAKATTTPLEVARDETISEPLAAAIPTAIAAELQQIRGIGPKLAAHLAGHGITRLVQVATLGSNEIARLDASAPFNGRITREQWVDQARALTGAADRLKRPPAPTKTAPCNRSRRAQKAGRP
ncbi:MAG: efflux RND transporter permease subunit [Hyphomicrobiaceae bacterium]|nr:efflux RND transporter permease subunit [Hyphomicrobiaceae bacterium]